MKYEKQILLKLLNYAIRKEKPAKLELKNVNWNYISAEAKLHDIYALLYPAIRDLPSAAAITNNIKEEWKLNTFYAAFHTKKHILQMSKVFKEFDTEGIEVLALKGLVLRSYYSVPDLRIMGDADILVHQEDIGKAGKVLTRLGYTETGHATPAHITFAHEHYSPIEIHWALADTRYIKNTSDFQDEVWKHTVKREMAGTGITCLCPGDFLMHLCIHMAVHMRSGGFGLRQLCDFALFVESEYKEISWDTFMARLLEYNIMSFTVTVFSLCSKILGLRIPGAFKDITVDERHTKALLYDIFAGGVFGMKSLDRVFGNSLYNIKAEPEIVPAQRMNSVIDIICPPASLLSEEYSYAKKYRVLVPAAWIHHFLAGILNKKYNMSDKLRFLFLSTFTLRKRDKLIRELGL